MKWIALTAAVLLSGCAATPADFTEHEQVEASKIRLYALGENAPAHKSLGKIESNSCDSGTTARYAGSRDEALLLLKLEAVRRGGDIVVGYSCATKAVDWTSNCWASQRCDGLAAKAN
ncbi:hypothetical protein N015_08515 [Pseudomonas asturiensis]|uniref:RcsF protein n=1 Tax=Pseudomonas asturiensis TaxID=1190415 RepID=A0ABX6HA88_9PSED|nr:hypothetical protein [Pseudomonas asturiensis]QHF02450.1 hypothetical protein N015_08515 [Pseudomonas asturiensis]